MLTVSLDRCTSVANLSDFRVEQPFERQLTGDDELPLLADTDLSLSKETALADAVIFPKSVGHIGGMRSG